MEMEMIENVDESIKNMTKTIKLNTPSYGENVNGELDRNLDRLEKLIVIRSALRQLYELPEEESSEEPENFDPAIAIDQSEPEDD